MFNMSDISLNQSRLHFLENMQNIDLNFINYLLNSDDSIGGDEDAGWEKVLWSACGV
jgi:hypothetical protein